MRQTLLLATVFVGSRFIGGESVIKPAQACDEDDEGPPVKAAMIHINHADDDDDDDDDDMSDAVQALQEEVQAKVEAKLAKVQSKLERMQEKVQRKMERMNAKLQRKFGHGDPWGNVHVVIPPMAPMAPTAAVAPVPPVPPTPPVFLGRGKNAKIDLDVDNGSWTIDIDTDD